jgi:hypothetical protein
MIVSQLRSGTPVDACLLEIYIDNRRYVAGSYTLVVFFIVEKYW